MAAIPSGLSFTSSCVTLRSEYGLYLYLFMKIFPSNPCPAPVGISAICTEFVSVYRPSYKYINTDFFIYLGLFAKKAAQYVCTSTDLFYF